jgi:predicted enzyme related to lactoylglutathione lyase
MSDDTNFGLSQIGRIAVNAYDIDRAVKRYSGSIIYFSVDDIEQATETLSNRGIWLVEKPTFVANEGFLRSMGGILPSSENNLLAIRSQVAHT